MPDGFDEMLNDEDTTTLGPKTAHDRFIVDHLQQMIVDKQIPEPVMIGLVVRSGTEDMTIMSLGADKFPNIPQDEILPWLVEATKAVGLPQMPHVEEMLGMVYVTTACRLVDNDMASEAYMEMRKWGIDVWLQDFPGAQKAKMGMLADGEGKVYLASMSEDKDGVQSYDKPLVSQLVPNLDVDHARSGEVGDGVGGRMAECLTELARMFRQGAG